MAVNFQDKKGDYSEAQVSLLCGKHAINNILQEEKLVWDKDKPLLIDRKTKEPATVFTNPLFYQTQLNLHKFCMSYPARLAAASQQSLENAEKTMTVKDKCNMDKGMIPFEGLSFILKDLQFRTEYEGRLTEGSVGKMTKPDQLLGVIFNLGEGHYTALSKFLKTCKSWTRNAQKRLSSVSYSYMDSVPNTIKCLRNEQLGGFLQTLPISGILYVYYNPTSYPSLSVKRAIQLNEVVTVTKEAKKAPTATVGGRRKRRQTRKYKY
jgi:hypothetical protein